MPSFEFQGTNAYRNRESGIVSGQTIEQAIGELSARGVKVERINQAAGQPAPAAHNPAPAPPMSSPYGAYDGKSYAEAPISTSTPMFERAAPSTEQRSYFDTSVKGPLLGTVPLKDLAFFYRQFATMLNAGVPIVQSLNTLATQARHPKLREILTEMGGHVQAGREVSLAMTRYPEVFQTISVSLVKAGEEGGFLAGAMSQLADYTDRDIELRNLYKRLTFMPKLEMFAAVFIVLATNGIISFLGKDGGIDSPLTTWIAWIILTPIIVGVYLYFKVGLANPSIKAKYDAFVLKVPYLGPTMHQFAMTRFGRAFGALYKGGVPIAKSFALSADVCGNEELRRRMQTAFRRLETGATISETFQSTGAFSPIVLDMVSTGETTGNLDEMLVRMSDFYEDEAKTRSTQFANVFGVVLTVLVGIYIGYVVITFYMKYANGVVGGAGAPGE